MKDRVKRFAVKGTPVFCTLFGHGHINETYLCTCDSGVSYILQKINRYVFPNPEELMENITAVTSFMAEQGAPWQRSMHLIPTLEGKYYDVDENGEYWRMYNFVTPSRCLQRAGTEEDFYKAGLVFGRFQKKLADFPAGILHEPIKGFHNTPERYRQFREALEKDPIGRAKECGREIEFALKYEKEAGVIVDLLESGELPVRVTHNDTKLNNILFDYDTGEPLCVIDLDTVMPGSSLYDYGDSIRFGASTAEEDEQDLSKVRMDVRLFQLFTEGYLKGCDGSLTEKEIRMLPTGAKLMTLECGVRFLTDYLSGDPYFRIHRKAHNLDRARTQFKLVKEIEEHQTELQRIVEKAGMQKK